MTLKIFYSIQNGGDGSAYPKFVESKKLAEFDQDHMREGWGESCVGSLVLQSDSLITCNEIVTKEDYFLENYCDDDMINDEGREFIEQFFPDGLPESIVKNIQISGRSLEDFLGFGQ